MSTGEKGELAGFGPNLRRIRELRSLTQAELGEKAGMKAASISHFETRQRLPSLESLMKLADALDVSTDVLLGRVGIDDDRSVDPVFLRASSASARTRETLRRITEALLDDDARE